jgi:hypothetical protein
MPNQDDICSAPEIVFPTEVKVSENGARAVLALEGEPDIAIQIALFISGFSALEVTLPELFAEATGLRSEVAQNILANCKQIYVKISMIDSACRSVDRGPALNRLFDEIVAHLKHINKRRNIYAHVPFVSTGKSGELRALVSRRGSGKDEVITAEIVRDDCVRVEQVSYAIFQFLKGRTTHQQSLRKPEI